MVACLPSQAEGLNRENPASSKQESIPQQTPSEVKWTIASSWSPPSWFTLQILDTEYSMWASSQSISVDTSYILSVLFFWETDTGAHQAYYSGNFVHILTRGFLLTTPHELEVLCLQGPHSQLQGSPGTFAPLSGLHHALQETWLWCRREHLVRVSWL